jgi:uncharacterized membrane protein
MHRMNRWLVALVAAAAGLAQAQEPERVWRGNFIAARQGLMMSPCRSGERLIVIDATPQRQLDAVYRELTQRPGRAIFMELTGSRNGRVVRAGRLHRAYAEGPGCREDLEEVRLRANGTEPFWHLDARRDAVLMRRPGADAPQRFAPAAFARHGDELRYEGADARAVLRAVVREAVCRDAMTGGYYTLAITLEWDGQRLAGCAYLGDYERSR